MAARWEALKIGTRKAAVKIIMPDLTLMPGRRGEDAPVQQRITSSRPGETSPGGTGSDWQGGSLKLPGIEARHAEAFQVARDPGGRWSARHGAGHPAGRPAQRDAARHRAGHEVVISDRSPDIGPAGHRTRCPAQQQRDYQ